MRVIYFNTILVTAGLSMISIFGKNKSDEKYAVGDRIKKYELESDAGKVVSLPEKHWTVLYFYPKDNTPGCTQQAKGFSALYDEYSGHGIVVYGISTDNIASHQKFKKKYGLKVTLLSDPKGQVAADFGVKVMLGMCSRDAIILDPDGKVDKINRSVSPKSSPAEVIAYIVEKINKSGS